MKLHIEADLEARCAAFLQRKLDSFQTRELDYFRLYDRTGRTTTHGVWGRCKFPNPKKKLGYRIRCSISITADEFPYPVTHPTATRQLDHGRWEWVLREDRFASKEEAFVWIAGHEAFHWLRHSRQIPGANYETQANRHGFAWLEEWRALTAATGGATGECHDMARLYLPDGHIDRFRDQQLAYATWLALPKGVRAAFRGVGDVSPVYPWDHVDAL